MRKTLSAIALAGLMSLGVATSASAAPSGFHVNLAREWAQKCKKPGYVPTSYFDAIRTRNLCRYYAPGNH